MCGRGGWSWALQSLAIHPYLPRRAARLQTCDPNMPDPARAARLQISPLSCPRLATIPHKPYLTQPVPTPDIFAFAPTPRALDFCDGLIAAVHAFAHPLVRRSAGDLYGKSRNTRPERSPDDPAHAAAASQPVYKSTPPTWEASPPVNKARRQRRHHPSTRPPHRSGRRRRSHCALRGRGRVCECCSWGYETPTPNGSARAVTANHNTASAPPYVHSAFMVSPLHNGDTANHNTTIKPDLAVSPLRAQEHPSKMPAIQTKQDGTRLAGRAFEI